MKNLFFLLALITSFSFLSCSGDDEAAPSDFITATVNGSAFEAATIVGIADATGGEEIAFMAGTSSDAFAIGLNIETSLATGTEFTVGQNSLSFTFTDPAENAFFTEGTFTLTNNDAENNVIEGTFSFTATNDADPNDVYTVTDGSFRVTYL